MQLVSKKNSWFVCVTVAVLAIFFYFHPPSVQKQKIIAGDGLGYYAYLPAKFIHNDTALTFGWFNDVFFANYDRSMSADPTNNFLVPYKNRMINLYYPGQSFLQMPFFFASHAAAKLMHYPPDGFSSPYQTGMGISALFYTLLGIFFCSRLILKLSGNRFYAILLPLLMLFGTNLFTFSIYAGCYTHCYSFCFVTLGLYFSCLFFQNENNKWLHFLLATLCAITVLFLRPVNCILLMSVLYFYRPFSFKALINSRENKLKLVAAILVILCVAYYNLNTMYTQTHSFFVNTYAGNKFYFNRWDHVFNNFFGTQHGILWYTPVIIICFSAILFLKSNIKILWLITPVLIMILLYSFWWYWSIINRTLADMSAILALLLLHLLVNIKGRPALYRTVMVLCFSCVPFYQLKAYQLRKSILNNYYTYRDFYFKNFFRLKYGDFYPVDPETVLSRKAYLYDYETRANTPVTDRVHHSGTHAAIVNEAVYYACTTTFSLDFFKKAGIRKVRVSFWVYKTEALNNLHLSLSFTRKDSTLYYSPAYMSNYGTRSGVWEYKEFGSEVPDVISPDDKFNLFFWNPDKKNEAFIDDLKIEFLTTDDSYEMLML